jgi:hypothetical protein
MNLLDVLVLFGTSNIQQCGWNTAKVFPVSNGNHLGHSAGPAA